MYKIGLMIVVGGDGNINYLSENDMRKQLDAMLISYNLTNRADFLTRIQNKSSTVIDNIFIDTLHVSKFLITPVVIGLSDDAQLLTINEINLNKQTCHTKIFGNVNKNSIIKFQIKLSYKLWDNVFNSDNGNNVDF
jgi:NAD kinase